MKSSATVIFSFCLLTFPWLAASGELLQYEQESTPPELSLPDLSGQQQRLEDYRGQVVLVNFWASWCPPCLAEMPSMQRLLETMSARPFQILAVNAEEAKSKVWKFSKLLDISFPTLLDSSGDVTRAWAVEVFPTSYLVDASGHIRYVSYGSLEWDDTSVVNVIETLMPDHGTGTTVTARYTSP
jgi:thiol-disulfide isomerase/thioredoxin